MKSEDQKIYLSSYEIRKKLPLPVNISSLLNVFEVSINDHNGHYNSFFAVTNHELFDINIQLQKAFLKFSKSEKIYHYAYCVEFLRTVIQNNLIEQGYKKYMFEKKCMEVRGYQRPSMLSLWEKILVVVNFEERTLALVNKGEEKYNLNYYYMRESSDPSKFSLIFECISPMAEKTTIRVGFDSKNFSEVKIKLRRLMQQMEKQRLFGQLKKEAGKASSKKLKSTKQFSYLNQQVLSNFKVFTQQVSQSPEINLPKKQLFRSSSKVISVLQGVYFLQQVFLVKKQSLMHALRVAPTKWNNLIKESVITEKVENGKLQALFLKFQFNQKVYQCMVATEEKNTQEQGLILFQTLDHTENTGNFKFNYMILRVIKISETITRLTIQTKITTGDENNNDFMIEYLMEYSNLFQETTQIIKSDKNINPYSKKQSYPGNVKIQFIPSAQETVYIDALGQADDFENIDDIDSYQYKSQPNPVIQTSSKNSQSQSTHVQTGRLGNLIYIPAKNTYFVNPYDFHHTVSPLHKDQPRKLTSHYLDAQWKRSKTGTLICTDQQVLNQQKKVVKHLLATFGRNLLKVKGFLNISLPVSVCCKKSHLQLIALNYAYAPLLLQPYANAEPLERMKRLVIWNMTVGSTGIAGGSQKPFNPILGQTYQATVDGCNLYLEQISHHPAVSAYFFDGRGFKCYGAVEPKIQIAGINSGRGYSDRDNKIQFDDGSLIYITYPRMFAKGFLFGQRQFNFDSNNFVYDRKNLIFAQILYGPRKTNFFGGSQDPFDFVHGRILKVKPSFDQYFKTQHNKGFPQKQHIVKQLATIQGLWTGVLKINGSQIYNFRKQLPCIIQDYPAPLPSNSLYRFDLLTHMDGNLSAAQQQKQRGQQMQRRDRNLRQKAKERKK